jgi:hypothetical protein
MALLAEVVGLNVSLVLEQSGAGCFKQTGLKPEYSGADSDLCRLSGFAKQGLDSL